MESVDRRASLRQGEEKGEICSTFYFFLLESRDQAGTPRRMHSRETYKISAVDTEVVTGATKVVIIYNLGVF